MIRVADADQNRTRVLRRGSQKGGRKMAAVSMTINGRAARGEVEGRTMLVEFLREHLGFTGTHVGCDTTQCGACIVHVSGLAMKSCTMLALQCEGAAVTTIEGLAPPGTPLHPMQAAFREHHALQCGYCTSGMVMIVASSGSPKRRAMSSAPLRRTG